MITNQGFERRRRGIDDRHGTVEGDGLVAHR